MVYPEGLAVSISVAATAIAKGKSIDEVNLLATVFTQLGDTLATIAATRELYDNSQKDAQFRKIGLAEDENKNTQAD